MDDIPCNDKRDTRIHTPAFEWLEAEFRKIGEAEQEEERLHYARKENGVPCPNNSCATCMDEQDEEYEEASTQQAPKDPNGHSTAVTRAKFWPFDYAPDEEWGDLLPATSQHRTPSPEPKKQPMSDEAEGVIESTRQTGVKTEKVEVKLEESETMALQKCARSGRDAHMSRQTREKF